jgi:PKD repeat protein
VGSGATYNAGDGGLGFIDATSHTRAVYANGINTSNSQNLWIEFDYIGVGQSGSDFGKIIYSIDGGNTWLSMQTISPAPICGNGQGLWTLFSAALPQSCMNIPNLKIGFEWVNDNDGAGTDPSLAINNLRILSPGQPTVFAGFTFSTNQLCQGGCVSFTNSSTGAQTYAWNFGNGVISTLQNPSVVCFDVPGSFEVQLVACNAITCDTSTQLINVLSAPNNGLEFLNGEITSLQPNALYQWLLCPSLTLIPGATASQYTPPINGQYAVIVTLANGCSDTSDCIIIDELSIEESQLEFSISPNPGNGKFLVSTNFMLITATDPSGRNVKLIREGDYVCIPECYSGLFYLTIQNNQGSTRVVSYIKE